jgi:hypothetical protein
MTRRKRRTRRTEKRQCEDRTFGEGRQECEDRKLRRTQGRNGQGRNKREGMRKTDGGNVRNVKEEKGVKERGMNVPLT